MGDFKTLAVLGMGVSNTALVREMRKRGVECLCWDDGKPEGVELTELTDEVLAVCDALVVSPGIAPSHEIVVRAQGLGVPVMCDVEVWRHLYPVIRLIAITGTNGKSTVTAMVEHGLRAAGVDAVMGGNIGRAVFDLPAAEWAVIEMSSYQIEYCPSFYSEIAVVLNISPDHLDRHGSMETYAAVKASLLDKANTGIVAVDDEWTRAMAAGRDVIEVSGHGDPAAQNEAVAIAVLRAAGVEDADLSGFSALSHRQNVVRVLDRVTYINDSKATNVEAARAALRAFDPVIWIVGGAIKDGGLTGLEDSVDGVKRALVIGAETDAVADWLAARGIDFDICGTMDKAVELGGMAAAAGDVVLLSPAAASFDQYANFEKRGEDFETLVKGL